ncbi:MAG: hypothetical protein DCC46_09810 [Armatimonadetes bacterium]|nr:MAG: hypothetical protein DCC46_09810 [Armatimonadota bacterium]
MDSSPQPTFESKYKHYGFWLLVIAAVVGGIVVLWPFVPAILWASVMAVLMWPIHKKFSKRLGGNVGALASTLLALAIVGLPLVFLGLAVTVQAGGLLREFAEGATDGTGVVTLESIGHEIDRMIEPVTDRLAPNFQIGPWVESNKDQIAQSLTKPLSSLAVQGVQSLLTLVFAFLTLFFLLRDGARLSPYVVALSPLPPDRTTQVLARMSNTIHGVFVGVILVAIAQGLLATLAYVFTGVPNALLWGALTIMLCMIPLLGAPIVYVPMALILLANGKTWEGVALLAAGFLVVSQIDNLLKPWVIGARLLMHPMAVFFALLGGVLSMGPIGLMAGPMLLALLLMLHDVVREVIESRGSSLAAPTAKK